MNNYSQHEPSEEWLKVIEEHNNKWEIIADKFFAPPSGTTIIELS